MKMTEQNLGKIERVDIREVWADEASDFTPWLANNLDRLGDELGMELELVQTEAPVGNYYLDILARNVNGGDMVAIENQIAGTDHTHLGQLMTYAAGHDAGVVIWVATKFRDEHRAALDWLNERSAASLDFFGVEIEAIKIGDSLPAPLFRLAVVPNAWSKQVRSSPTASGLTERQQQYVEFWRPLLENLNAEHGWNVRTHNRDSWFDSGSGLRNFGRTMRFAVNRKAQVQIRIDSGDKGWNETAFDLLERRRDDIEAEMGEEMVWDRNERARVSHISVERDGTINDSEEDLKEIRRWMIENVEKIKDVFLPHMEEVADEMSRSA